MKTCCPCLGTHRHGGGGKILYLFQLEIHFFSGNCQFCHILQSTSRMTADKIGYDLLSQSILLVDFIKPFFELFKQGKRRLAHQIQHIVRSMFRCHFQSSANMTRNQFNSIISVCPVHQFILSIMQNQVITNSATDITSLNPLYRIYLSIDFQQFRMICIQVGTNLRMNTRRTFTLLANGCILTLHTIHIGRGTTQVGEITFKVGHLNDFLHLIQNAFFAAIDNELPLMGRDCTESTPTETTTM